MRSNGGGNPNISSLLYSFISLKPFHNIFNYRTRTIDIAYPEYAITNGRKMSDEDIQDQKNFLYQRYDRDDKTGFYIGNTRLREGQLENFPPDKDAFKGNVYVLTGGEPCLRPPILPPWFKKTAGGNCRQRNRKRGKCHHSCLVPHL
ncbi:hypothetical protein KRR40_44495 [Niabella defluvii]|nr:hypothetical protein KRR40_44495 [Niabella sp. I65]